MPEGPEIRIAADQLEEALVGKPVCEIFFAFPHLKAYEPILTGEIVSAVETYGKAILTRFTNDLNIYTHNQLYGVWVIRADRNLPETNRQLRLAIYNQEHSALLYSASDIEVLHSREVAHHPFLSKIGPDLLDPNLTVAAVAQRLQSDRFRRRRLASLLLDQHFLAGLGNYLRSEILHRAGIHPSRRPLDCSPAEIEALARATLQLTRQSYETGGITNDLELVGRLKDEGWEWRSYRWSVFGRDGCACHRCGTSVDKKEVGGRRLYYCAVCQPPPVKRTE